MWLARNKDGKLFIWRIRPIKIGGKWGLGIGNQCSAYIPNDNYPEVKWSDKEPRELVLKPKVGWKIFPTKKEAEENFKDDEKYITTANIQWRDSNDNL